MAKSDNLTTQITVTVNAKTADKEIRNLKKMVADLDAQIIALSNAGKGKDSFTKTLIRVRDSLNAFDREFVTSAQRVQGAIDDLSGHSVSQLRRARRAAQEFRDSYAETDPEFKKAQKNLEQIQEQIDIMTGKQRALSDATENFAKTMKNIDSASVEELNSALKDAEVMLTKMSRTEVEKKNVIPGMNSLRQEIANRKQMTMQQYEKTLQAPFKGGKDWNDLSVEEINSSIAIAKQAKDALAMSDPGRQGFVDYIARAEEQLRKLNGTFVDADKFIKQTYSTMKDATPKQLAEAISLVRQKLDTLPESAEKARRDYTDMMNAMIRQSKLLGGALVVNDETLNKVYSDMEKASPRQLAEAIAYVKQRLYELPPTHEKVRASYAKMLEEMEAQTKRLNGTLINTDEVINKTFSDLENATPKQLTEAITLLKQKLDSLPASEQKVRKNYNDMIAAMLMKTKELNGQLVTSEQRMSRINAILLDKNGKSLPLSTIQFDKLREAAKLMREEMSHMAQTDPMFDRMNKKVAQVEAQVEKSTAAVNKHGSAWKTTIRNMISYAGIFGTLNLVKAKLQEIVDLNIQFSQQLADVRKVSGLASKDIKELGNNLAKIDSRTSLQGLMQTAYEGAKLGFGDQGVEGLSQFVKAANVAQVSIGEELGEDALPALSKIVENMGIIKRYGIEQSMLKTASAMFKLSSTSTATSGAIVEFSKRLTAMSRIAGISTDQLLALGSASDSMYLMPEVSATAFQKLITSLQTNHNLIEKSLKIESGTISELFSAGKAMDAIVLIFQKMHDMGNMNALKPIFKNLGGEDGARLMNVMATMAKNVDTLKAHLKTSAEAFREGTAATAEYNIQQETAAGLMERAKNLWQKAVMNPEDVDIVHEFAKAWYDVSKSLTTSKEVIWLLHTSLSMLVGGLKLLISLLPGLIGGLGVAGLASVYMYLDNVIETTTFSVKTLTVAFKSLSAASKFTWIAVIAGTIIQAAYAFDVFGNVVKDRVVPALGKLDMSLDEVNGKVRSATVAVDMYRGAIDKAAMKSKERNAAIANFNKIYGQYYKNMLTEASSAKEVAAAYQQVVSALKAKMYLEGKQADIKQFVQPRVNWSASKLQTYDTYNRKSGNGAYNAEWLKGFVDTRADKNMSAPAIARDLAKVFGVKNLGDYTKYIGTNPVTLSGKGKNKNQLAWSDKQLRVLAALNYIYQDINTRYVMGRVNQKWGPVQKDIDRAILAENATELPGSLDRNATDKDALAAAKTAAAKARKEHAAAVRDANEQFKNAKDQATAVISAIDEYYNLQKSAAMDAYNAGQLEKESFDQMNLFLEKRRNEMLQQARLWMTGQNNDFERMRKEEFNWGKDRFDLTSKSEHSVQKIMAFDGTATYNTLKRFDGKNGMPDGNSEIDAISKNASSNELKNKEAATKVHDAVMEYLNKNDVANNIADKLALQLGSFGIAYENPTKVFADRELLRDDHSLTTDGTSLPGVVATAQKRKTTTVQRRILDAFIKNGTANYGFDPSDETQLYIWLSNFLPHQTSYDGKKTFGSQFSQHVTEGSFAALMPGSEDWLNNFEANKDKVLLFYQSLIEAEDDYYNAMKSNTDREKRILDERWNRSGRGKYFEDQDRQLQVQQKVESIYGRGETSAFLNTQEMARNNGFADNIANDPEVQRVHNQMVAMREKLELARQTEKDEQAIRDAEHAAEDAELAYAEKINSSIKERMDLLKSWVDPLQDFSEQMGEAFVKMTESANEGQEAMREATQNMVKTFAKMTIDMIAQQLKMEVQRALFHKRMQNSEADYLEGMEQKNTQGHQSILKRLGSFFSKKKKTSDKQNKDEKKQQEKSTKEQTSIVTEGKKKESDFVTSTSSKMLDATKKIDTASSQQKQATATTDAATTAAETQGNIFAGIASGAAKIIGKLGFWGIPLIAVIQGLLMGLLNSALGKLFGGKSKSSATTNTKLVSGMLTYDSGNVEAFSGAIDKKTYPVVGNDGKVYAAKPTDKLVTGLLTEPVATTVNGVPSLIAERGPEMIIGRETTQALMMARPDIISEIVKFDRNHSGKTYRAYDSGNVSAVLANSPLAGLSSSEAATNQADLANLLSTMQAMMPAMEAFVSQLQKPINAKVAMYGHDGIYESYGKAVKFMKGK